MRDLTRFHIVDFNPYYAPRTDALLFTYAELAALFSSTTTNAASAVSPTTTPVPRVIDSQGHRPPIATRRSTSTTWPLSKRWR